MFKENKYTKYYFSIIEHSKTRLPPKDYTEKHHIIPKCMGGDNDKDNLVILTYREHFLCHWLLTKMTESSQHTIKMNYALARMTPNSIKKNRRIISSWQYETMRKSRLLALQGRIFSIETRKKMSESAKRRIEIFNPSKGKKYPENTRKRMGAKKGAFVGENNPMFGRKHSPEAIQKIKEANKKQFEKKHPRQGLPCLPETIEKIKNQPKYLCAHCNNYFNKNHINRWHGDNCKEVKNV